jgi:hypothetical protein
MRRLRSKRDPPSFRLSLVFDLGFHELHQLISHTIERTVAITSRLSVSRRLIEFSWQKIAAATPAF